jgi:hypothetical protein
MTSRPMRPPGINRGGGSGLTGFANLFQRLAETLSRWRRGSDRSDRTSRFSRGRFQRDPLAQCGSQMFAQILARLPIAQFCNGIGKA